MTTKARLLTLHDLAEQPGGCPSLAADLDPGDDGIGQDGINDSDVRMKEDIAELGRLANGLGVYRFRYVGEETVHVGVMAQEVLAVDPGAVIHGSDGYLRVNYERLGLRMMTWQEWLDRAGTEHRQDAEAAGPSLTGDILGPSLAADIEQPSDARLKEDIAEVGRLANGLGLYRFRYIGEETVHVGVMAQEVVGVDPLAVVRGADGYLRVNYDRLGIRMMTWEEWVVRNPHESLQ